MSLRTATIALKCTPVLLGSALGNKGVQLLLDGVCHYLPGRDVGTSRSISTRAKSPSCSIEPRQAARHARVQLEDGRYGQRRTSACIRPDQQGRLRQRAQRQEGQGRPARADASDDKEEIPRPARATSAIFGVDCNSGDTFRRHRQLRDDVDVRAKPGSSRSRSRQIRAGISMSKGAQSVHREDPTFKCWVDPGVSGRSSPAWADCTSTCTSSA